MLYCRDCDAAGPEEDFSLITQEELREDFEAGDIDGDEYQEALQYEVGRYRCGCLMSPDD